MLPAVDLAEIISSLASLQLEPDTTAAVLGAVLPPLLRSSEPEKEKRVSATATIGTSGNGTVHVGGRENSG